MTEIWRIKHDGQWKTFSALGLAGLRRTLSNQTEDTVEFSRPGASFDEDELWEHGTTLEITRNLVQWFVGRVVQTPRDGGPGRESVGYRLAGPWHWLDHIPFQQSWKFADENGDPVSGQTTHLFLGQTALGERMTTGEQIEEIIQWAADCGAPLQSAGGFPEMSVPIREIRDLTCGEAIRQMLRWHPDAVVWFDYSTSPPTLHIARRADLVELVMAVGQKPLKEVSITPRRDLQVPAVVLKFEITDNIDGNNFVTRHDQVYPPSATSRELGALVASVDLMGSQATHARAVITVQEIETDELAWWRGKLDWLEDARVTQFSVSDVQTNPSTAYTREIIEGQWAPWMNVGSSRIKVRAKLHVKYSDPGGNEQIKNEIVTVPVLATNAPVGEREYYTLQSFASGEDEPTGLAQGLYESLNTVQFEGRITLHEAEVGSKLATLGISGRYGVGCRLNLTGGMAEWAAMDALIQQVTEDVDAGTTTFTFGPAGHLGHGDLIELLRMTRLRWNWTALSARTDPRSATRGEVELGRKTPSESASAGASAWEKMWIAQQTKKIQMDASGANPKQVITDGTKIVEFDHAHLPTWATAVKWRKAKICLNGIQMVITGPFSLAYDPETGKKYDPETGVEVP